MRYSKVMLSNPNRSLVSVFKRSLYYGSSLHSIFHSIQYTTSTGHHPKVSCLL